MRLPFQISSIIIALLFVYAINFKSFVTFNYFINQTEIAELFCINKEKPELQCGGKCHLATQLNQVEDDEDDQPFSQRNINYNIEITSLLASDLNFMMPHPKDLNKNKSGIILSNLCKGFTSILAPPPKV